MKGLNFKPVKNSLPAAEAAADSFDSYSANSDSCSSVVVGSSLLLARSFQSPKRSIQLFNQKKKNKSKERVRRDQNIQKQKNYLIE